MKISDILREDKTTISFEVFPPKTTANFESVKKAALGVAALHPDYMSVTYGAGGSNRGNTLHIAEEIQKAENVTTIAHLTCVGAGKEDIRTALSEMKEAGIENILALRGDRPKDFDGDPFKEYHYASELVATIKEYGDFCVGGACYPEGHPDSTNKKEDIKNLKKKVDAGCEFLTTQMFFDNNIFYSFLYKAREAGILVPVIPGIMPITRANQVENAVRLSGCNVPERFRSIVDCFGENPAAMQQAGIAYATDQIIDLIANGIRHIHVYSMNKPEVAKGILDNLSDIVRQI
ncbi:MAG: methylenetetrahydrofolate reductase [NAD(P)H] [Lachnospiraceae bacterium]|nr:methylenetetrahydrofolate reductase [NAD(P)H] [Lachnospiraceae bacterium]MDD6179720.1 methylenetetrahydrofolate reductase [NAD(P)H] [Clostridium sp.]MDY4820322.1 methylenetetrahydrofolate reductase [NAD(P)H] [Lachnospiraceae bacterium]